LASDVRSHHSASGHHRQFARGLNADIEHIALATDASLLLVAPATANIIGKFANASPMIS
jgi:phosphopantothenoylcysteine synthetase/decarboxylase